MQPPCNPPYRCPCGAPKIHPPIQVVSAVQSATHPSCNRRAARMQSALQPACNRRAVRMQSALQMSPRRTQDTPADSSRIRRAIRHTSVMQSAVQPATDAQCVSNLIAAASCMPIASDKGMGINQIHRLEVMIISVPKESFAGEKRVALTPDVARRRAPFRGRAGRAAPPSVAA